MREIKFRVWVAVDKAFAYFDIYEYPQGVAGGVSEPQEYTGIKDKNGKEIYEGDIITGMHDYGPAGFNEAKATVTFHVTEGYQWSFWELDTVEVIGNIFENLELCVK